MQVLAIIFKVIPFLFSMVRAAEVIYGDGTGEKKKQAVKDGVRAMVEGAKAASTGGQKETFEAASPLIDDVVDKGIDLAAKLLFPKD